MGDRPYFPLRHLRELMDPEFVNKQKINCIKHLRTITGEGLKEAKDFFEQEWLPFINGDRKPPEVIKEMISDTPEFHALVRQVQALSNEVAQLRRTSTKNMAAGIFAEEGE